MDRYPNQRKITSDEDGLSGRLFRAPENDTTLTQVSYIITVVLGGIYMKNTIKTLGISLIPAKASSTRALFPTLMKICFGILIMNTTMRGSMPVPKTERLLNSSGTTWSRTEISPKEPER